MPPYYYPRRNPKCDRGRPKNTSPWGRALSAACHRSRAYHRLDRFSIIDPLGRGASVVAPARRMRNGEAPLSINCVAQDDPCTIVVPGQVFCDDFTNPDPTHPGRDPVRWWPAGGAVAIVDNSLQVFWNEHGSSVATPQGLELDDVSIRTQVASLVADYFFVQARLDPSLPGAAGYTTGIGADGSVATCTEILSGPQTMSARRVDESDASEPVW